MSKENKEILTATSPEGDTSVMVCSAEGKGEKVCLDLESKKEAGENMLDNNTYNLMEQLTVETRSLWRIKNNYRNDASMDNESKRIWSFIEKDKQEIVKLLKERLKERL